MPVKSVLSTVAVFALCLTAAGQAGAAKPATPFPVTTGAVQSLIMRGGLQATHGTTIAKTSVTRAVCAPAAPPVRGIGYDKLTCLIWTPSGHSTISVSTFSRDGVAWFFRWRYA